MVMLYNSRPQYMRINAQRDIFSFCGPPHKFRIFSYLPVSLPEQQPCYHSIARNFLTDLSHSPSNSVASIMFTLHVISLYVISCAIALRSFCIRVLFHICPTFYKAAIDLRLLPVACVERARVIHNSTKHWPSLLSDLIISANCGFTLLTLV